MRDFRGDMAGRGDKGLLTIAGTFTREAQIEASRDGASPVELIDGDRRATCCSSTSWGEGPRGGIDSTFFEDQALVGRRNPRPERLESSAATC